jgi:hypothetical protein
MPRVLTNWGEGVGFGVGLGPGEAVGGAVDVPAAPGVGGDDWSRGVACGEAAPEPFATFVALIRAKARYSLRKKNSKDQPRNDFPPKSPFAERA